MSSSSSSSHPVTSAMPSKKSRKQEASKATPVLPPAVEEKEDTLFTEDEEAKISDIAPKQQPAKDSPPVQINRSLRSGTATAAKSVQSPLKKQPRRRVAVIVKNTPKAQAAKPTAPAEVADDEGEADEEDIPLSPKKALAGKKNGKSTQAKGATKTGKKAVTGKKDANFSTKSAPIIASEVIVIDDKFQPSDDPAAKKNAERSANRRKKLGAAAKVVDALKGRRKSVYAAIGKIIYEAGDYKKYVPSFTKLQKKTLAKMEGKDRFVIPRVASTSGKSGSGSGKKTVGKCMYCIDTCNEFGCVVDCACYIDQMRCYHIDNEDASLGFCYVCDAMPDRHPRYQLRAWPEPFLENSSGASTGLQANEDIPSGFIIGEYTGNVYRIENEHLFQKLHGNDGYIMDLMDGFVVDVFFGNELRFINSACKPNAQFEVWQYTLCTRIFLRALVAIPDGTFIYAKYRWSGKGFEDHSKLCSCGLIEECRQGKVLV